MYVSVMNMTLVVLPHLPMMPLGDHPKTRDVESYKIIYKHLCNPNCLVMTIFPAYCGMYCWNSSKLATDCGVSNYRIIAVLANVDLMDRGTDCVNLLKGEEHVECFAVKSRDQETNLIRYRMDEQVWFQNHDIYSAFLPKCGAMQLANKLEMIFHNHLYQTIPLVSKQVQQYMTTTETNSHATLSLLSNLLDAITK